MSNELKHEHAKRILEDKLFVASMQGLRDTLVEQWKITDKHDIDAREQIWLELKMVDRFEGHLQSILEEGQITNFKLSFKEI